MNTSSHHSPGNFFDRIRLAGFARQDDGAWAAGVCAAVADRLGWSRGVVRIVLIVLALCGGLGVLLYGLAWLMLPGQSGRIHAQDMLTGDITGGNVAALALTVVGICSPGFWTGIGAAIVAGLAVWLLAATSRQHAGPADIDA
ncbi:PspC domain-containing protein [Spelaeicoccus albus]|uniref:Phage shock protein PspC (Stress-responsive transcriptional regulator) n=1 Tax=Spelaeicoccus albus TaxID=1280376 RepID=A0A7Z0D3L2_9MICO|nr:PspC domain-containing protein [Spelaeicoccus albus]NYI68215.1 phage shock protein PspC (stress-responsive transcriptional regulator) [Spelaeicoccus albus]